MNPIRHGNYRTLICSLCFLVLYGAGPASAQQSTSSTPATQTDTSAQAKKTALKHPQEPLPPFPYINEEVLIENTPAKVKLAGTLSMPSEGTSFPALILITGSGPQDRNEELFGHKPFLLLADYLCRRGFAVLRYDDRGTAKSTGDFASSTTADFAGDVKAAVTYLKSRPEINCHLIGLLGHSEGGMIAPMIASEDKDIAFLVLLAGPGIKCAELLTLQSAAVARSMGASDLQIALASGMNKKIYAWAQLDGTAGADSTRNYLLKSGMTKEMVEKQVKAVSSAWFKYFISFDPAVYLSKVTCQVLALNGTKDIQVPYKENLEGIHASLQKAQNGHLTAHEFPGLNHLFQHCDKCTVAEYAVLEQTMDPEVLSYVGQWLRDSVLNAPDRLYEMAVKQTCKPEAMDVYKYLTRIDSSNKELVRTKIKGEEYILMLAWKQNVSFYKNDPSTGFFNTGNYPVWVTAAPDLKQKIKALNPGDRDLRLRQLLGLPPHAQYSSFVEFWVRPADLFRPCPDKEISDAQCDLCFPSGTDSIHISWINTNRISRYYNCEAGDNYPWTQLGYTYDWNAGNKSHIGLSEFVIYPNRSVRIRKIYTTKEYLGETK
ncbi:MAG: alpha/beta hydrolase family protein [Bacteroidia bacterium]